MKVSLGAVERLIRGPRCTRMPWSWPPPDERWGQVPVIVTAADVDLAGAIAAVVTRARRAPPGRPACIHVDRRCPLLPSGKVDRVALAALAARAAE